MEIVEYKGYEGSAELDTPRGVCRGKLLYIDDLVTYEGSSLSDLQAAFEAAVDDYLDTCKQLGREPQVPQTRQREARVSDQ